MCCNGGKWLNPNYFERRDLAFIKYKLIVTYQAHKDAEKLHNVSVRHWVEPTNEGVEDGNQGWDHHRHVDVDVYDHAQGGTCGVTQAQHVLHGAQAGAVGSSHCGKESANQNLWASRAVHTVPTQGR